MPRGATKRRQLLRKVHRRPAYLSLAAGPPTASSASPEITKKTRKSSPSALTRNCARLERLEQPGRFLKDTQVVTQGQACEATVHHAASRGGSPGSQHLSTCGRGVQRWRETTACGGVKYKSEGGEIHFGALEPKGTFSWHASPAMVPQREYLLALHLAPAAPEFGVCRCVESRPDDQHQASRQGGVQ